jgi:phage terminase small subunit
MAKKSGLTDRQKRFAAEYLMDLNATQAAIRAGYSEKSADVEGHQLKNHPLVAEEIARLQKEWQERTHINLDWVLRRFVDISNRCMQEEPVKIFDGKEWVESGEYQFDSSGAIKATENIARHLGFYAKDKEKPEEKKKSKRINVTINVPPFPPAEPNGGQ